MVLPFFIQTAMRNLLDLPCTLYNHVMQNNSSISDSRWRREREGGGRRRRAVLEDEGARRSSTAPMREHPSDPAGRSYWRCLETTVLEEEGAHRSSTASPARASVGSGGSRLLEVAGDGRARRMG